MSIENRVGSGPVVRQQVEISQEQFLSGQKDLNETFRKALPNRFQRAFHYHRINLKPAFFRELRDCYEFAIRHQISKGPLDFTHALADILPKSGNVGEDRRVFSVILASVKQYQAEFDRLGLYVNLPPRQPVAPETAGKSVPSDDVSVEGEPVTTPRDPFDDELSVSSDSLYEVHETATGDVSGEPSESTESLYDAPPPTPGDDERLDEWSDMDDDLPPLPGENDFDSEVDETRHIGGLPPPEEEDPS